MASFVNPNVLGTASTFHRVFQQPIEKGATSARAAFPFSLVVTVAAPAVRLYAQAVTAARPLPTKTWASSDRWRCDAALCTSERLLCHTRIVLQLSKLVSQFVLRRTSDVLKSFLPPKSACAPTCSATRAAIQCDVLVQPSTQCFAS